MNALPVVRATATARVLIGAALALATRPLVRAMVSDEEPSSSFVLFARTVGIRDALFGAGLLMASMDGKRSGETRRWVQLWLANEVADVIAAMTASRRLGLRGAAAAAAAPLPLIAADVWALRQLRPTFSPT
jgi:hypothetical protein